MEKGKRSGESRELVTHPLRTTKEALITALRQVQETYEAGKAVHTDPEVRAGSEAVFRAVMNIAISCVDILPGAGELASWGADLLKVIEEIRYRQRKQEVESAGGDVSLVKREKYNLTPDVHVSIATVTEVLELISAFTAPTHAIETTIQLWHDIPRMLHAFRKARALLAEEKQRRAKAKHAAELIEKLRASNKRFEEFVFGKEKKDDT